MISRDIAFVVFPGFQIQDLSGPLAVFENAAQSPDDKPYDLHIVSQGGGLIVSSSGLPVMTQQIRNEAYDTVIFMGGSVVIGPSELGHVMDRTAMRSLRSARRIASVCTGAFILASAGWLDGRRATTHWKYAGQLQRLFPKIKVESDRIFVKDGDVWTSAGVTAGIDLGLAMVEEDLGLGVSKMAAQTLVVYHRRPGGQSQFSAMLDMEPTSDRIRNVLTFIRENLTETLTTEKLADVAHLSPRQFGRAFLSETGETPAKAVERLRAEVARVRVERGAEPIEVIARQVGFVDPERMRRAFIRIFGHPPQGVRRMAEQNIALVNTSEAMDIAC